MPRTTPKPDLLGAIAGIAFAVLLFGSVFVVDPLTKATDQELREWWADGGLRRDLLLSTYLRLLAGPCFLVFLTRLRARLRTNDLDGTWSDITYGAGLAFVAMLTLSTFSRGLIAQAVRFADEPIPGPDTLRYATQFSLEAYGLGAIPFATMVVAAASLVILRTGALPRWVGWFGLVVTALSLVAVGLLIGAFATPLILLWVVGVSAQLFRTHEIPVTSPATSPAMA